MSFLDFSAVWESIASNSPIVLVIGASLVLVALVGIPWLQHQWEPEVKSLLRIVETILTIFFLILAMPGLVTATIQSGSDPRVVIIAILVLEIVLFARLPDAFRELLLQSREKEKDDSSGKPLSKERTPVPAWATVGVILGVSALVLLRRTKVS